MGNDNGQVNVGAGTFKPGTSIKLHDRLGDARAGKSSKSATLDKDGTASFTGLKAAAQYWLVGDDPDGREITVAATAKAPAEPARPRRDPAAVQDDLKVQALEQGPQVAAPVEGMRSSANVAPKSPDQAQRNKETMESALRTAEALKKADLVGAQVDQVAAAQAGLVTVTDASGAASIVAASKQASESAKPAASTTSGSSSDAAARRRSAASKKAAATRRRNAAARKRASASKSKSKSGSKKK